MELLTTPPPGPALQRMLAIDGVSATPTMLAKQEGLDRHMGPEAAGAVLILQATFTDPDGAVLFWDKAAELMGQLAEAPGFIRRYNFADGPHYTLIAFWRTAADANAFFASAAHQDAMRSLFRERWQYTHFAGLWEAATPRKRVIFCQNCDGVTPSSEGVCSGCGVELVDPYVAMATASA